jgi:hypothetical protein
VYTATWSVSEAARLTRSLGRVLASLDKLPAEEYSRHVSLGDVDQLLALKTALGNAGDRGDSRA